MDETCIIYVKLIFLYHYHHNHHYYSHSSSNYRNDYHHNGAGVHMAGSSPHHSHRNQQHNKIHCSKCYRVDPTLWCTQCTAAYCGVCWGQIPHHDLTFMTNNTDTATTSATNNCRSKSNSIDEVSHDDDDEDNEQQHNVTVTVVDEEEETTFETASTGAGDVSKNTIPVKSSTMKRSLTSASAFPVDNHHNHASRNNSGNVSATAAAKLKQKTIANVVAVDMNGVGSSTSTSQQYIDAMQYQRTHTYSKSILFGSYYPTEEEDARNTANGKRYYGSKSMSRLGASAAAMVPLPDYVVTEYLDYPRLPVYLNGKGDVLDIYPLKQKQQGGNYNSANNKAGNTITNSNSVDNNTGINASRNDDNNDGYDDNKSNNSNDMLIDWTNRRPYTAPACTQEEIHRLQMNHESIKRSEMNQRRQRVQAVSNESTQSTMRVSSAVQYARRVRGALLAGSNNVLAMTHSRGKVVVRKMKKGDDALLTRKPSCLAVGADNAVNISFSSRPSTRSQPLVCATNEIIIPKDWNTALFADGDGSGNSTNNYNTSSPTAAAINSPTSRGGTGFGGSRGGKGVGKSSNNIKYDDEDDDQLNRQQRRLGGNNKYLMDHGMSPPHGRSRATTPILPDREVTYYNDKSVFTRNNDALENL